MEFEQSRDPPNGMIGTLQQGGTVYLIAMRMSTNWLPDRTETRMTMSKYVFEAIARAFGGL